MLVVVLINSKKDTVFNFTKLLYLKGYSVSAKISLSAVLIGFYERK